MRVNFYATLRAAVGKKSIDLPMQDGGTALDLARMIAEHWPPIADQLLDRHGDISTQVQFMIGGRNIRWLADGSATQIRAEDIIDVFPPSAGG